MQVITSVFFPTLMFHSSSVTAHQAGVLDLVPTLLVHPMEQGGMPAGWTPTGEWEWIREGRKIGGAEWCP